MAEQTYPYDDDYFKYDYDTHRYVLTSNAILDDLNMNMSSLNPTESATKDNMSNVYLKRISDIIYRVIYRATTQPQYVEYLLAKCPSARNILKNAMEEQFLYMRARGDLSLYGNGAEAISPNVKDILEQPLTETGLSAVYRGQYSLIFYVDYTGNEY